MNDLEWFFFQRRCHRETHLPMMRTGARRERETETHKWEELGGGGVSKEFEARADGRTQQL